MKYAIIESGGKQYKVSEGQDLDVDRLDLAENDKFKTDKVLLVRSESDIVIGDPYVQKAQVSGHVLKNFKGDKIHVFKFKAKVRYRRKTGFRPQLTKLRIDKIATAGSSEIEIKKTILKQKAAKKSPKSVKKSS